MLTREGFLWCRPLEVSQQAISQRFLTFPAQLFEKVFKDLLPHLQASWQRRNQRKIRQSVQFTLTKFEKIWIVDCSILEALFQKLESLKDAPQGKLAGKSVLDMPNNIPNT